MADGDADVADVEVALRPRGRRNRRESGRLDFAGSRKATSTRSWCGARRSRRSPMEQWRDEREPSRPKSEQKRASTTSQRVRKVGRHMCRLMKVEGSDLASRVTFPRARDVPATANSNSRPRASDRPIERGGPARSSLVGRSFALGGPLLKIWLRGGHRDGSAPQAKGARDGVFPGRHGG